MYESFRGLFWSNLFPVYLTTVMGLKEKNYEFWNAILHSTSVIIGIIFTPFFIKLERNIGTKNTWIFSFLLQIPIGFFVFIFVSNENIYAYYFFYIILSIFSRSSGFLIDIIKSNVYDYDYLLTGVKRVGIYESIWRFIPRYLSLPGLILINNNIDNRKCEKRKLYFILYIVNLWI
jgi:Na+/melibiose symporter-like transporter